MGPDLLLGDFNITRFNELPPTVILPLSGDARNLPSLYIKNNKNGDKYITCQCSSGSKKLKKSKEIWCLCKILY